MERKRTTQADNEFLRSINRALQMLGGSFILLVIVAASLTWVINYNPKNKTEGIEENKNIGDENVIVNGLDGQTSLVAKGDYMLVKTTCTACHSSSLILNAKLSRSIWIDKIKWMQAKQKLWDLGANEKPILDYLEKYYGPDSISIAFRKPPLKDIKWYTLH